MGGITGSPLFETAIGLVLVWFVTATLCSGIVELIAPIVERLGGRPVDPDALQAAVAAALEAQQAKAATPAAAEPRLPAPAAPEKPARK